MIVCSSLAACTARPKDTLPDIKNPGIAQPYPPLPSDQVAPCRDPGIRVGQNVKAALAQNRLAFKSCRSKHQSLVRWYQNLRSTRKPK